jgi:hypothetical protein
MPKNEVTITEIAEFEPSRVDGVGKGANGFPILMLKSIGADSGTVDGVTTSKAAAHDACGTCEGEGTIMEGNRKCPKCLGTGKAPKVGESAKQFIESVTKEEGVAASGSGETPAKFCPTCNGDGFLGNSVGEGAGKREVGDPTIQCPDCGGTGLDESTTNAIELNAIAGDPGRISVGDPEGREKMDKAKKNDAKEDDAEALGGQPVGEEMDGTDDDDDAQPIFAEVDKAKDPSVGGGVDREKLAESDFAGKNRSFPIVKPGDVSDAASSLGRAGADNYSTDKIKANIIAIAQRKGKEFVDELPQTWKDEMAEKGMDEDLATVLRHDEGHDNWHRSYGDEPCTSDEDCKAKAAKYEAMDASKAITVSADGAVITGANPAAIANPDMPMPGHDLGNDPDGDLPGGPAWEALDAEVATRAALALMQAAELIRHFAQREAIEVAAGEGNDIYDAGAAAEALCGVSDALGIMAQLAFHESLEAQKGLEDEDVAKAGKRLSGQSIAALATARDHLNILLGDDDPAKQTEDDSNDDDPAVGKYTIKGLDIDLLTKEIEDMTTEELEKVLDARDERLVGLLADTFKAKGKKTLSKKSDDEKVAEALDDAEDAIEEARDAQAEDIAHEGEESDDDDMEDDDDTKKASATCPGCDMVNKASAMTCKGCGYAMKSLTPEEIEAKQARKEAKKALKAAEKAEKEAAENAAVAKSIAEGVAEANAAVLALQERLATVEKMAAPSNIVRTAPQDAVAKGIERDTLEMRLAAIERIARETPDMDIRKAKREEAAEIRVQIATLSA